MTVLEKQLKVEKVLYRMCGYGNGCQECEFFKPEDETDGKSFCAIRDSEKRIPFDYGWDIGEAMIDD